MLDLTYEIALASNPEALIDHLDLMLTAGRLRPENRETLVSIITAMPGSTSNNRKARAQKALYLFSLLPEFNVIY